MGNSTVREELCPDQELIVVTWQGQGEGPCHGNEVRLNLVPLGMTGELIGELVQEVKGEWGIRDRGIGG